MRKLAITGLAILAIGTSAWAIEPGNWEATSRLNDLQLPPDLPPQAADMMRTMLGGEGMTTQNCVTQDDLDNAPENIFNETDGECRYTEFEMAGGEIHAIAECQSDEGTMNMQMDGSYTASTYEMTMQMRGDMGMGPMTMIFDVTGKRLGPCE